MTLKELYCGAKKHAGKFIVGSLIFGASVVSLDSLLNTQRGSFVDPENSNHTFTEEGRVEHRYSIRDRGDSRTATIMIPDLALTKYRIRDDNKDGMVNDFRLTISGVPGASYIRLDKLDPVNTREKAQRLYDLVLADAQ